MRRVVWTAYDRVMTWHYKVTKPVIYKVVISDVRIAGARVVVVVLRATDRRCAYVCSGLVGSSLQPSW